jgi:hypothetical protein
MISPRSRVTSRRACATSVQMGVPTSMTGSCISRLISSLSRFSPSANISWMCDFSSRVFGSTI